MFCCNNDIILGTGASCIVLLAVEYIDLFFVVLFELLLVRFLVFIFFCWWSTIVARGSTRATIV